jgi:hypothetical protein
VIVVVTLALLAEELDQIAGVVRDDEVARRPSLPAYGP